MAKRRKSVTLQVHVAPETQTRLIHGAHQWDWSLSQVVREGIRREHGATIRAAGLRLLSYTLFWHLRGAHLKGRVIALCDTWQEAREAVAAGWRTSVHVTELDPRQGKTAHRTRYTLCPAQRGKGVTCNDCGLCDVA